ncbi:hypothetical protein PV327_001882 [Microctonus hyperodae]|uniref:BEN domain-containing protein n=1 Tax=Microctonus hyperodae TaxID=165561 RepID=A0AA39KNP0_MICHY|nr:hypothetical protein PV327_001882 [Microctonus hyperodae]
MYALIYFDADKSSSAVNEKFSRCPPKNTPLNDCGNVVEPDMNDRVEVLWENKYLTGKILCKTSKSYLDKLSVEKNEELEPPRKKQMLQNNVSNLTKKRDSKMKNKMHEESQESTQELFNEFLLTCDPVNNTESHPPSPQDNVDFHATDEPNESICKLCSSIPITAEVVTAFEVILAHVKKRFESNARSQQQENSSQVSVNPPKEKQAHWQIPGFGKERLIENLDVWMEADHLRMITEMNLCNPNEMVRKLLIFLLGEEKLANSCALGQGGKPAIDPMVYTAVKSYVMKHVPGVDHTFPFNRIINQLCASRAAKYRHQN